MKTHVLLLYIKINAQHAFLDGRNDERELLVGQAKRRRQLNDIIISRYSITIFPDKQAFFSAGGDDVLYKGGISGFLRDFVLTSSMPAKKAFAPYITDRRMFSERLKLTEQPFSKLPGAGDQISSSINCRFFKARAQAAGLPPNVFTCRKRPYGSPPEYASKSPVLLPLPTAADKRS